LPAYSGLLWSNAGLGVLSRQSCAAVVGEACTFDFTHYSGTVDVTGWTLKATLSSYPAEGLVKSWTDSSFSNKTSSGAFRLTTAATDTELLASRAWVLEVRRVNSSAETVLTRIYWTLSDSASFDSIPVSNATLQDLAHGGTEANLSAAGPGAVIQSSTGGAMSVVSYATFAGLISGTYQPFDADLAAISALSGTDTLYYRSGANTWSAVTFSGCTFSGGALTVSAPASGSITSAMLRDSAAHSVIGRSANSVGAPADIVAPPGVVSMLVCQNGNIVGFTSPPYVEGNSVLGAYPYFNNQTSTLVWQPCLFIYALANGTIEPDDSLLDISKAVMWLDPTEGAAKIKFKAYDDAGNLVRASINLT